MESFFEWFLESSLLVLMIIGIRKIFMGKIRYGAVYALWLLVLLRFVIPVNIISTPVSVANLMSEAFSEWEDSAQAEAAGEGNASASDRNGSGEGAVHSMTGVSVGVPSAQKASGYQQTGYSETGTGNIPVQQGTGAVQDGTVKNSKTTGYVSVWRVFKAVRFPVSAILFLWLFVTNASLLLRLKRNRVLYGERESLKIYMVSGIKNPCLYGFFRPSVYLPDFLVMGEESERAEEEELEQMITHELVHYRHGDHIWAMLRILFVSLYWFNPFAWLAASCSKKDAELFCDETVIYLLGEEKRFSYGEMLVRLAGENHFGDFRYSMMSMSRRGKEMKSRIRAISERRHYSKWILIPLAAVLFIAVGVTCSSGISALSDSTEMTDSNADENADGNADKKAQTVSRSQRLLWTNSYMAMGSGEKQPEFTVLHNTASEAFEHYIEVFTDSVNTGSVDAMYQVLAPDRAVYRQQCDLVKNYYRRGIREKVISCSVVSERKILPSYAEIDSAEEIRVSFADASTKVIHQSYRYTCEKINGTWVITKMSEIA